MTKNVVARYWGLDAYDGRRYSTGEPTTRFGLRFIPNDTDDDDQARQFDLPVGWGNGAFSLTFLARPMVAGSTAWGTIDTGTTNTIKKRRWSTDNSTIYSSASWWVLGNFLLDGFNNLDGSLGSLCVQLTNNGRVQVLFGDGAPAAARTGDVHGLRGTTSIIDGEWHRITFVRRSNGAGGAILELWVDGVLEDTETSTGFADMYDDYWQNWTGFPIDEPYFCWGAEKISGNGGNPWEDYMGDVAEISFVGRDMTEAECENWQAPIGSGFANLLGQYRFEEQTGTDAEDVMNSGGPLVRDPNSDAGPIWLEESL